AACTGRGGLSTYLDGRQGGRLGGHSRRGKAVEINALWYNALCLLAKWSQQEEGAEIASTYRQHAERARDSFNQRFWNPQTGYLFDVIDGESGGGPPGSDPACRPNQLFAISL